MNTFHKGAVLLVLSALGFGLLPIFALFAYQGGMNVSTLLFIRFFLAAAVLFSYLIIKYKKIVIHTKELFFLFVLGGICYNLQARFYFSSIQYIPASLASLLVYTNPMMVAVLSFLIDKEKLTKKMAGSMIISFIGLMMILGTSIGKMNGLGIVLALGAAFIYAVYIVFGNHVVKKLPPLVAISFITLFSSIGVFALGLINGDISFNFEAEAWFPAAGLVLLSTVLAMLFFFRGMELLGPSKASIISMMEPVFTVVFSTLLFHDRLSSVQLTGGVLVLSGALFVIMSHVQNISNADTEKQ